MKIVSVALALQFSLNLVKDTNLTFPTVLSAPVPAKNIDKFNCKINN